MVTERLIKNSKYQSSRRMYVFGKLLALKDWPIKNGATLKEFKAALKSS